MVGGKQRRTRTKEPQPVDVYVGGRIKERRGRLGMSQQKLAEAIGLSFQQVQKYERGTNRVGSSRLFEISFVLRVPVTYFFEKMPQEVHDAQVRFMKRRPR